MAASLRNIKLSIEYDGTCYAGWQRQKKNTRTVQETIEHAIGNVVGEDIILYGAGRTDAGVHAKNQVAHFRTTSLIPAVRIPFAINDHLPDDVAIKESQDVDDQFHSRFSAKWKVYRYTVYNANIRPVLNRDFCCACSFPLNYNAMVDGAALLTGTHDFSSFKTGALPDDDNVREMKRLEIERDGRYLLFTFEANGFLRYMVRRIVGVLLLLGRGKISTSKLQAIIDQKNPLCGSPTAPAKGLCLLDVKY